MQALLIGGHNEASECDIEKYVNCSYPCTETEQDFGVTSSPLDSIFSLPYITEEKNLKLNEYLQLIVIVHFASTV